MVAIGRRPAIVGGAQVLKRADLFEKQTADSVQHRNVTVRMDGPPARRFPDPKSVSATLPVELQREAHTPAQEVTVFLVVGDILRGVVQVGRGLVEHVLRA